MRFFSKEWLSGELSDEVFEATPSAYRLHLAALRLPPDLVALSEVNVHDGWVLDVRDWPESAELTLRFRCGDLQRGYWDLSITYSGARVDDTSLSVLRDALRVPKDEILYGEVDRVGHEYQHRFILSSLREAAVTFTAVTMASFPVSDREHE
jgi:hypothetical protein